jgi:16S rRNA (adenine1518-N6/adenine1519-N6)-dimethyltransferase
VIPARRRWGQHFLTNPATAEQIVRLSGVGPNDTVVEVGPGEGALTRPLARRAARLLAIEIDPARARALAREFAGEERVRVVEGNVLDEAFGRWLAAAGLSPPAVLVANLPYNVATPILLRSIEEIGVISRAVAMVQREVARRFVARPGEEGYGYLSVRRAAFAHARILLELPPGAFRPRPKVSSSLLELSPRPDPPAPILRDEALRLASLAFRSRRKTLPNALAAAGARGDWQRALARLGKGERSRPEELSLEDYVELARRVPEREEPDRGRA